MRVVLAVAALAGVAIGVLGYQFNTRETAAPAPEIAPPPSETFAAIFTPCAHCHQIGEGARNTSGPVLTGIIGQKAGSSDYPFSEAMRESGIIWDEDNLAAFIANPHAVVPGTRMAFAGMAPEDIAPLVAFIADPRAD